MHELDQTPALLEVTVPQGDLQANMKRWVAASTYYAVGRYFGVSSALIWKIVNEGHEPKDPDIRARMGLAPITPIEPVEQIEPGSQAFRSRECQCGRWFVPNTAKRRLCFICSPYQGQR